MAVVALLVLAQLYLTKIHANITQQLILSCFALIALWQAFVKSDIDLLCLLLAYLGLNITFTLYRTEGLTLITLIVICAMLTFFLSMWQGHKLFSRELLWRHAYLVSLCLVESAVILCYWYIFDDPSSKALLLTLVLYLCWGTLELESEGNFKWRGVGGFLCITLLLVIFVLVTMKPVIQANIR